VLGQVLRRGEKSNFYLFEESKTNVRGFIFGKKHWTMMCPATLIYQGKFGGEEQQKGNTIFKITFVLQGYYFRP
jgi:hypothetical protein